MINFIKQFILLCVFFCICVSSGFAKTIRCEDIQGKTIFTNKPYLCANYQQKTKSKKESLSPKKQSINTNQPTKKLDSKKLSFRVPKRRYKKADSEWNILIEKSLIRNDFELSYEATKKLEKYLNIIFKKLPEHTHEKLKNINVYLMYGKQSPNGGKNSGMSYFRKGEPKNYRYLDPRWENVIVIYSAKNWMYLNGLWAKKALTHEFAHAWHLLNYPSRHPLLMSAYKQASKKKLYQNVKTKIGETKSKAYAAKNHREYFAELSAMYFVGADYYPFSKKELKRYDFIGFKTIKQMWE